MHEHAAAARDIRKAAAMRPFAFSASACPVTARPVPGEARTVKGVIC